MGKKLVIKGADFSQNGIGAEYTTLTCIVATSATQWMTSPVKLTKLGKVVMDITIAKQEGGVFGYNEDRTAVSSYTNQLYLQYVNSNWYVYFANKYALVTTDVGTRKTWDISNDAVKVDGTQIAARPSTAPALSADSVTFGVFGQYANLTTGQKVQVGLKLYSVKMYSNANDTSTLVLDAIPVKRNEDNKICLYDKVSGTYIYTNDGTNPDYEV